MASHVDQGGGTGRRGGARQSDVLAVREYDGRPPLLHPAEGGVGGVPGVAGQARAREGALGVVTLLRADPRHQALVHILAGGVGGQTVAWPAVAVEGVLGVHTDLVTASCKSDCSQSLSLSPVLPTIVLLTLVDVDVAGLGLVLPVAAIVVVVTDPVVRNTAGSRTTGELSPGVALNVRWADWRTGTGGPVLTVGGDLVTAVTTVQVTVTQPGELDTLRAGGAVPGLLPTAHRRLGGATDLVVSVRTVSLTVTPPVEVNTEATGALELRLLIALSSSGGLTVILVRPVTTVPSAVTDPALLYAVSGSTAELVPGTVDL